MEEESELTETSRLHCLDCIVLWYHALFSFSLLELSMEGAWHCFVSPECISPPAVLLRSSAVGTGLHCLILDCLVATLWHPELRRVVGLRLCSGMNWSPLAGPLCSTLLAVSQRGGLARLFLQCNVTWKWFPQKKFIRLQLFRNLDCAKQPRQLINKNPLW